MTVDEALMEWLERARASLPAIDGFLGNISCCLLGKCIYTDQCLNVEAFCTSKGVNVTLFRNQLKKAQELQEI